MSVRAKWRVTRGDVPQRNGTRTPLNSIAGELIMAKATGSLAVDDKHIRDTNSSTSGHTISVQSGYLFSSIHLSSMWLTFLISKWSFEPPTIEL
jgi:hypothetical protein